MPAYPLLRDLEQAEPRAIVETLAFMSFNVSIGRVLAKGSVATFTKMVDERVTDLGCITCQQEFEQFHRQFCMELKRKVKTARDKAPVSYGQVQKPLNVFLKIFIDWASLPNQQVSATMRPLLHVPLDSIVMRQVKRLFREQCDKIVRPAYAGQAPPVRLSLVNARRYLAWQACFRAISPDKPVLLDVLWNLGRSGGRASSRNTTGGRS